MLCGFFLFSVFYWGRVVYGYLFHLNKFSLQADLKQKCINIADIFKLLPLNVFAGTNVKKWELKRRQLEKWEQNKDLRYV